jgi:hypothetical protein
MSHYQFRNFDYSKWTIPKHDIIKNEEIKNELYDNGFYIFREFLQNDEIEKLKNTFFENHSIESKTGGFFVSLYSKDLNYRKFISEKISSIILKKITSIFGNFKVSPFVYMAKFPGKGSEMFAHQDMSIIDEFNFSDIGIWIPLQKVTVENGTIGIIPKSQFTIPPHRSLNHKQPFSKINDLVLSYMQPVLLNAGDLLIYDPRIIHNSSANLSNQIRLVVAGRLMPKEARFNVCFKNPSSNTTEFDLIEIEEDFMFKYKDFISEKIVKPGNEILEKVIIKESFVDENEFLMFCITNNLKQNNIPSNIKYFPTVSFQEPDYKENSNEKSLFSFLNLFKKFKNE